MTTRSTSREAYRYLVKHGLLKGQQQRCLDKLINMGTATSRAVIQSLKISDVNAWRARFTELHGRGLIIETGSARCPYTGRMVIVWAPTGRTKPLDGKRGARVSAKAWKALALEAIGELREYEPKGGKAEELAERARKLGATSS